MKKILILGLSVLLICLGCGENDTPGNEIPSGNNGNQSPSVFAGDDRTVAVGDTVTLDGSKCSDGDGDPLTYEWQFTSLPEGSAATLSNRSTVGPTFEADKDGQYIVELRVSDSKATVSDAVIITASKGQTTSDCSQIVPGQNIADDFVCAHNEVRANAQPTPSPPLPKMTWDPALARIAQDHAEACVYQHNDGRGDTYPGGSVGENIYASYGMSTAPGDAVALWADEDQYYDYDTATCHAPKGKTCYHYTQIVRRATVKVGCAKASCPNLAPLSWPNADFIVCNYSPGNNYLGVKPY